MRASARALLVPFSMPFVWRDRGANPQPTAPEVDALTTRLSGPVDDPLIQEEQLSVDGERLYTTYWLTASGRLA